MKLLVIIQSRMGSSRFPGKSFYPLKGKPALQHHIDSLLQLFSKEEIVVATSTNNENDVIRLFCNEQGISCYSGEEQNVASRFLALCESRDFDYFVRINGDSPLIDYRIIEHGISELKNNGYDMVTTMSSNFPSGMNMELVRRTTFCKAYPSFSDPGDFEHVTKYLKDHKEQFNVSFLRFSIPDGRDYKFSFDTEEDLARIEKLFDSLEKPHFQYTAEEKCALYDKLLLT